MISVWRAHGLIALAIGAAITALLAASQQGTWRTILVAFTLFEVIVGGATAWIVPRLEWERWSFEIGRNELNIGHGILTRHRSSVPYYRLQHVDITSGPIERALGVSKLVVRTAAASTDAVLPGIPTDQANELRDVILTRAGRGDAV
jgi:membrane protein YdbS with pleckstrin-like domain